jgi:viroplasmin and RNaseH domain-containing protein
MILIGRPIEGIALNGLEYLMNEDNTDYKFFNSKEEAMGFLRDNMTEPVTDEELEDAFMFLDTETDFENPEAFNKNKPDADTPTA